MHRSARADRLAAGLAEVLRDRPGDPFAADVVAVPAKGVERWLSQRLAHVLGAAAGGADGVCANIRFPSSTAVVAEAVAAAGAAPAGAPATDDEPWARDRMLWTLLEVIDDCASEDWCATLAGHLGLGPHPDQHRRGRRLATARQLGWRFDAYGANRPGMLREWARGDDTDGVGDLLPPDLRWQAELWRRLRERIGIASPAERLAPAALALREHPELVGLPERLSLFGPTRLTAGQLEVITALAVRRDVHLWLPHPSPALWCSLTPYAGAAGPCRRREDRTVELPRNPLLASLGRDARELQLRLASCDVATVEHHHPVDDRPATRLGRLQRALQDDAVPPPAPPVPGDRSVAVHACHGPARQVEVLREVLVGLLAADPTLEPRDIVVMCPDVEDYAPLVSAAFGLDDDDAEGQHPGHRLRVRLADRSLRQTNPLLATVAALLELADARLSASQLLDLASTPPVRRRFGFTDDDLERLHGWVADSGVRWGLDAAHRGPFGLQNVRQNTWAAGLDRILLGAAMAEDGHRWVGLALPLDDVDSSDVDLAGRLAELIDRVTVVLDGMAGEQPLADWLDTLTRALDALTAVADADVWQSGQARRELGQLAADAGARAGSLPLSLADVRALLADRLQGRPTRANFRTGHLTMCSMVPMRSVPHRVVCLLGLDDGRFPRSPGVDGDDVLARDPVIGERDPRSEDRQLLLDAVLAAGEHLVILYTGADPRTNARRPPAVPVGEILDALDALEPSSPSADARPARDFVVHHPLQPFDARNFHPGELGAVGPFSFDRHALRGAVRAAQPRHEPAAFLPAPLPPPDATGDVAVADLGWFLEHPARGFLRQRLGVTTLRQEDELADALSVQLAPLDQWAVGDRLLQDRLAGADPDACRQAEWRRGTLPPRELGTRVLEGLMAQVESLVTASADVRVGDAGRIDLAVDLEGRRITGTVGSVYGDTVVRVVFSRLAPKHRLRGWVQLLALAARRPGTAWRAVTVGAGGKGTVARSVLGPVDGAAARRHLADLVGLRARGLCAPLPMAVKTSATYAAKRATGMTAANAVEKARREWVGNNFPGEQADPAHALVWGEDADLAVLLAEPAATGDLAAYDESTRFGVLARQLWQPLLDAETEPGR